MIAKLINYYRRLSVYNQTRKELMALTDRELCDIGLSRCMIDAIALESARLVEDREPKVTRWFNSKTEDEMIANYLADSISIEDLERRQRLINRNQAPWQRQANQNLAGWV